MKPNFFLAALFTTFWPVLISAQDWQYAKRYSAATGSILTNAAVSTAPDGSTYLVGTVRGTVMFDNISVSTPTGITQSYLLKLDMGAQAVWVQTFDQKAYDVTTDAQGNVFVAGAIAVGSPASDSLTFIAKYDANGQLLASLESSGAGKSWAKAVRTDAAGNCYATGWKTGTVSFGAFTLPDQGNRDNFLVKLSPDLALVNWAVNTGSSNKLDEVYDLELDDNGGIYTAGNYSQTFQLIPCFCYNGSFFTEKRSTSNGALFWQKIYSGGSGTSTQQVLALAGDGQTLYTASSFKNTVQIPPNITLTAQSGTDDYQLFAAGLNSTDGNVQWAKKISFTGDSYITGMAWAEDTLHLHGYFKSNTLMGNVLLEPLGTFDAFYTEVAPANGNVTNAEKFTGNGTDQGLGIVSGDGRLAVSGNTSSNSLTIGNFNLPGSTNSIYVAGKIFDIPLNISISNITDASCPGIADGSATVAVQGGVSPYTYLWNNGQTDATATGLAAGSYTVTVTDGAGTQISATATITEPPALTAGFANSVNGLSVSFSNNSSNAASYLWNFGDGQTSTEANPAHTYANCGAYSVTLTATNLCGTATSTANITIGNGLPVTGFANTVNGLSVSFFNNTSNAASYLWNFGDGQTSTEANPAHTYANCGMYTVTLTATNLCGTATSTANITIGNGLPVTGFANTVNGLSVSFFNNTSNATSYTWNFGDGQTSTAINPVHTFANCGIYTVTLTATNLCGNNTSMATVTIGNGYPEASFVSTVDSLSASFSNNSSNATSYTWNFGDGQTSSEANPEHTYTAVGSYTVTLIAGNMCGTDTFSQTVIITPFGEAPIADFTADKLTVCAGDTIHFTNLSVNANTLSWWFPGGEPMNSTEANPAVVFNDAGLHSVVLTVYNDFGEDQEIKAEYIIVIGLPVANFGLDTSGLTVTFSDSSLHADNYFWEFGDGTSSTEPAPSHTYANPGAYTIRLTVQNTCGADVLEKTIELGIVSSSIPGWLDALRLYPNPNNGVFNLELNGPVADAAEFDLFGVDGRLIRHETAGFSSGFLNHRFECSEAPAGSYLLRIRIREKVTFAKVLIQR